MKKLKKYEKIFKLCYAHIMVKESLKKIGW